MDRRTAILVFAGAAAGCRSRQAEPKLLTSEELSRLLEQPGDSYFLDVREPEEIERLGSVPGYMNIPLGQLEQRINEIPRGRRIVPV